MSDIHQPTRKPRQEWWPSGAFLCAGAARVRVRVWERLQYLRGFRCMRWLSRRMGSVDASVPRLIRLNTSMSDNLLKMRIHFVQNAYLMQNIFIRCVFYPWFCRLSDI